MGFTIVEVELHKGEVDVPFAQTERYIHGLSF
jgi:hypothetical protein